MSKDKQTEAMKLALKALEESKTNNDSMEFHDRKNKAITALIEALAEQPAQQEPVAQWQKRHPHHWEGKWENTNEHDAKWWRDNSQGWEIRALYTTPQARPALEWVGLTGEKMRSLINEFFYEGMQPSFVHYANFALAIEAKLKAKNERKEKNT